jgi:hypothetical protein
MLCIIMGARMIHQQNQFLTYKSLDLIHSVELISIEAAIPPKQNQRKAKALFDAQCCALRETHYNISTKL